MSFKKPAVSWRREFTAMAPFGNLACLPLSDTLTLVLSMASELALAPSAWGLQPGPQTPSWMTDIYAVVRADMPQMSGAGGKISAEDPATVRIYSPRYFIKAF